MPRTASRINSQFPRLLGKLGFWNAFMMRIDRMIERQDEPRRLKDSKNLEEASASATLKGPALRAEADVFRLDRISWRFFESSSLCG